MAVTYDVNKQAFKLAQVQVTTLSSLRHLQGSSGNVSAGGTVKVLSSAITSGATLIAGEGPPDAFRLDEVPGVAVEFRRAEGRKCARSWKILPSVGSDPEYPDVSPRDAQALREWDAMRKAAE